MKLISIGTVRSTVKEPTKTDWGEIVSEIILNDKYKQALDHLGEFSHIIVLYWMNRLPSAKRLTLKVHPQGRHDLPLVGVFASRSPARPNPIGLTIAKIMDVRDTTIKVRGLDAIDGTPVLDIKPYIPKRDSPARARLPVWLKDDKK